jgi:hypothetical protein
MPSGAIMSNMRSTAWLSESSRSTSYRTSYPQKLGINRLNNRIDHAQMLDHFNREIVIFMSLDF